jgi:hypothetical protein
MVVLLIVLLGLATVYILYLQHQLDKLVRKDCCPKCFREMDIVGSYRSCYHCGNQDD